MIRTKALTLLLTAIVVTSCGGPPKPGDAKRTGFSAPGADVPVAILVEQVISGEILNLPMSEPYGLAVDFRDILFVTDAGNNRVIRFNADLRPEEDAGGFGYDDGALDSPSFLIVDNSLNLVVSDVGNRRLCSYDAYLHFARSIELTDDDDPLKYGQPAGLALTDYGELWYSDFELGCLVVFDNVGRFDRYVGDFGYTGGQLSQPQEILRDPAHNQFIVCDAGNGRLMIYDQYGNFEEKIEIDVIKYPIALALGENDQLWVLDGIEGRAALVNRDGEVLFSAGPVLPGDDRPLREPSDIVRLSDGRIIISDTGNDRLLVCRPFYPE